MPENQRKLATADVLDRIDEIVPPGTNFGWADRATRRLRSQQLRSDGVGDGRQTSGVEAMRPSAIAVVNAE